MVNTLDKGAIGRRLREMREAAGKSIIEASEGIGIGRTALQNYELGYRIPQDPVKIAIASYYGRPVEEIFYAQ